MDGDGEGNIAAAPDVAAVGRTSPPVSVTVADAVVRMDIRTLFVAVGLVEDVNNVGECWHADESALRCTLSIISSVSVFLSSRHDTTLAKRARQANM